LAKIKLAFEASAILVQYDIEIVVDVYRQIWNMRPSGHDERRWAAM
jgi:hypothetical protein